MTDSSALIEKLTQLVESDALKMVGRRPRPLSLGRALGVERSETAHSKLLATLLRHGTPASSGLVLRAFLAEAAGAAAAGGSAGLGGDLRALASAEWAGFRVIRERFRIDLVVEIDSGSEGWVIGIENKLDAGEQVDQVARYQAMLAAHYAARRGAIVFLTPRGREPTTGRRDDGVSVPWIAVGYGAIARALRVSIAGIPGEDPDAATLSALASYVEREIVKTDPNETLARRIWIEHGEAIRVLWRHRPRLANIRAHVVARLTSIYGSEELWFLDYPTQKGPAVELKIGLHRWDKAGIEVTFMIRERGGAIEVRALLFRRSYERSKPALESFAAYAESTTPGIVDPLFRRIPHWSWWHRVLREEDHPPSALVSWRESDLETAEAVIARLLEDIELLRPIVEGFISNAT